MLRSGCPAWRNRVACIELRRNPAEWSDLKALSFGAPKELSRGRPLESLKDREQKISGVTIPPAQTSQKIFGF